MKSPNILIDEHWHAKTSDFNLSEILRHKRPDEEDAVQATNPIWLAPELLAGGHASRASDVYSYGLVRVWERQQLV